MYGVPGKLYAPAGGKTYTAALVTGLISAVEDQDIDDLVESGCVGAAVVNAAAALGAVTSVGGRTGAVTVFDGAVGGVTPAAGAFTTVDGILGSVTPAAATVTGLTSSGYIKGSVGAALTAVGTNRGTGLQLAKEFNYVSTAATGTGVILPVGVIGMEIWVFVDSGIAGAAVQVYASGSETIDTVAGSTGVPLTKANRCIFKFIAANTWVSAQLGVASA
jgi:hypothetical protein